MLDDKQKDALRQWYRRQEILDEARRCIRDRYWEDLEEHLHMRSLIPLGRTRDLPDYLLGDDGSALLPSLNPRDNLEAWQDAVEIAWEVMESDLGLTRDEVHRLVAQQQKDSWDDFMKSVEKRKREREGKEES